MKKLLLIFFLLFSLRSYSQGLITNGKMITPDGGISSGLLLGSSNSFLNVPVSDYSAEAKAYFARMDILPAKDTLAMLAEFIDSLVLNKCWDSLLCVQIYANNTANNACLNIKNSTKNATLIANPTFVPYKYIQGNGTSSYILTGFTRNMVTRNNFSMGVYAINTGIIGWQQSGMGGYGYVEFGFNGNNVVLGTFSNETVYSTEFAPVTELLISASRVDDSTYNYKNGINVKTSYLTYTPSGNENYPFYLGGLGLWGASPTSFSTTKWCLFCFGNNFTATQHYNFNSCVQRLKTKIGW